jgi:hypothetical protein
MEKKIKGNGNRPKTPRTPKTPKNEELGGFDSILKTNTDTNNDESEEEEMSVFALLPEIESPEALPEKEINLYPYEENDDMNFPLLNEEFAKGDSEPEPEVTVNDDVNFPQDSLDNYKYDSSAYELIKEAYDIHGHTGDEAENHSHVISYNEELKKVEFTNVDSPQSSNPKQHDSITIENGPIEYDPTKNYINLADCPHTGRPVINSIRYSVDGNYKLKLILNSQVPINFANLFAGKCSQSNPQIQVINERTVETTIIVDLNMCQLENDFHSATALKTIEDLNAPIRISFELHDENGDLIASYVVFPHSSFWENYVLNFKLDSSLVNEVSIDSKGHQMPLMHEGLHFTYNTVRPLASEPVLAITPTNGFSTMKMTSFPETCILYNAKSKKTVTLWNAATHNFGYKNPNPNCQNKLKYHKSSGSWHMGFDFLEHFPGANISDLELTCSVRMCANVNGNECFDVIDKCGYDDYTLGKL